MRSVSIKIFIPRSPKGDMWKARLGRILTEEENAPSLFTLSEKFLRSVCKGIQSPTINVMIVNNTIHPSRHETYENFGKYKTKQESMYALICFLEDYLPAEFRREKLKKYAPK